ncbi:MAG: ComF family protein, partial [Nitrososphaeraceae archaeon]
MRTIGSLDVVSFYKYSIIENILLTKHTVQGFRIFNSIAKITMKPFIKEFIKNDPREVYIIGV